MAEQLVPHDILWRVARGKLVCRGNTVAGQLAARGDTFCFFAVPKLIGSNLFSVAYPDRVYDTPMYFNYRAVLFIQRCKTMMYIDKIISPDHVGWSCKTEVYTGDLWDEPYSHEGYLYLSNDYCRGTAVSDEGEITFEYRF